jgi:predicted nucleic acid-binding protein
MASYIMVHSEASNAHMLWNLSGTLYLFCLWFRYPGEAATAYGEMRAALEARGEMIGGNDLWIAAHANSAGLTLVTNNEREFKRVTGLKLQNWTIRHP